MKQPKPLSITELNKRVRELLESRVPTLWVIAEISNLSQRGASGHLYFKLKDAQAQVDAVLRKELPQR